MRRQQQSRVTNGKTQTESGIPGVTDVYQPNGRRDAGHIAWDVREDALNPWKDYDTELHTIILYAYIKEATMRAYINVFRLKLQQDKLYQFH